LQARLCQAGYTLGLPRISSFNNFSERTGSAYATDHRRLRGREAKAQRLDESYPNQRCQAAERTNKYRPASRKYIADAVSSRASEPAFALSIDGRPIKK